jgi:rod shape determining protein RodA
LKRRINIWQGIDKITILIFLIMVIMGWFNIYAAVYNEEHKAIFDFTQRYGKQFIWVVATLFLAFFIVLIDSRFYFFFAYFVYAGLILLLMLVLVFGKEINGAKSWFEFGSISLQPSEFAKFATALALAAYLNHSKQELKRPAVIIPATGIIILPALLIALQPDMGSTIVYFAFFIVLFREGMSPYVFVSGILMIILFFLTLLINNLYLMAAITLTAFIFSWFVVRNLRDWLRGAAIILAAGGFLFLLDHFVIKSLGPGLVLLVTIIISGVPLGYYIFTRKAFALLVIYLFLLGGIIYVNVVDYSFNNLLKPHQKERVEIMLGFKSDPHGTGYNVNQSMISIGSGGFAGKGYLQGTQTKFKFVPAQSTDFIFCTVGEEWGFIGSLTVVGLYMFLLVRLVIIAERQRSAFSRVYGYGVVSVLFIHVFINIGMAIGLVPVIGIPLPFFSYGGSSLWGFTILLFIFLRLDASRTEYLI